MKGETIASKKLILMRINQIHTKNQHRKIDKGKNNQGNFNSSSLSIIPKSQYISLFGSLL